MKKILSLITFILLLPSIAFAQAQYTSKINGGTGTRRNFTMASIAFGSVTASNTVFLNNSSKFPIYNVDIMNLTDAQITCTFADAATGADHFTVPAYSSYGPEMTEAGFNFNTSIWCKRTSAAPTVGSVFISAGF